MKARKNPWGASVRKQGKLPRRLWEVKKASFSFFFLVSLLVLFYKHACALCVPGACEGQKTVLDPLEPELHSYDTRGCWEPNPALGKSSQCPELLSPPLPRSQQKGCGDRSANSSCAVSGKLLSIWSLNVFIHKIGIIVPPTQNSMNGMF